MEDKKKGWREEMKEGGTEYIFDIHYCEYIEQPFGCSGGRGVVWFLSDSSLRNH